jgi:hypothetical protein
MAANFICPGECEKRLCHFNIVDWPSYLLHWNEAHPHRTQPEGLQWAVGAWLTRPPPPPIPACVKIDDLRQDFDDAQSSEIRKADACNRDLASIAAFRNQGQPLSPSLSARVKRILDDDEAPAIHLCDDAIDALALIEEFRAAYIAQQPPSFDFDMVFRLLLDFEDRLIWRRDESNYDLGLIGTFRAQGQVPPPSNDEKILTILDNFEARIVRQRDEAEKKHAELSLYRNWLQI